MVKILTLSRVISSFMDYRYLRSLVKMLEPIEDEYDLAILRQAMAEEDGVRISHEDLMAAEFCL